MIDNGSRKTTQYVESTEACMYHPGMYGLKGFAMWEFAETKLADLGYVGGGMPTTDEEAKTFAANVADPVKHLNDRNAANAGEQCRAITP